MVKRHSDGQELGELVITVHHTYMNPGDVVQSDLVLDDFGFHYLNLCTNLRSAVLIQLEYLQLIDVRLRDFVVQDVLSKTCSTGLKIRSVFIRVS
jgi:hypothetical protein